MGFDELFEDALLLVGVDQFAGRYEVLRFDAPKRTRRERAYMTLAIQGSKKVGQRTPVCANDQFFARIESMYSIVFTRP